MNRSILQFVLRHADPDGSDADLLRRYLASGDESAFAALVRRHGPMVWAVCRQSVPNRADAEDAFQAVFLALTRSARSVRRPEYLGSWLHGAAVRIAAKAKRGFVRRHHHERATAKSEADTPVSAANWNELLAAVHDEVARLPRSLRAVFVLCDLEGVDQAAAAARLGVKVNTLSGQLARARSLLLNQLTRRGVGAGLAAIGSAVAVPQALADKAAVGAVPTATVLELAAEITAMNLTKFKLLAAGLMLTCGLTLSGLGLISKVEGQPPRPGSAGAPAGGAGLPGKGDPGARPTGAGGPALFPGPGAGAGLPGGPVGMAGEGGGMGGMMGEGGMMGGAPAQRAAFEYLFVAKPGIVSKVMVLLQSKATQNWEYTGPLDVDPNDAMATRGIEGATKTTRVVLVFKRATPQAPMGMAGGMGGGMMPSGPGMGAGPAMPGGAAPGGGRFGGGAMPGASLGGGMGAPSGEGTRETKVFRLKHKQAEELADVVKSTYTDTRGKKGDRDPAITPDARGNALVVTGATPDVTIVGQIIAALDVPPTDQYEVIPLKNAKAEDVVRVLNEVFNGPDGKGSRVAVVAEKTSNSVVVTKASAADLKTIKDLLKNAMDVKAASGR